MQWQMNKCYSRPFGPEKVRVLPTPSFPLPSPLSSLCSSHTAPLHNTLSVSHGEPRRPIKVEALVLTTGLRAGYVLCMNVSLQKSELQLRQEGTLNAGQAGISLPGFSVTFSMCCSVSCPPLSPHRSPSPSAYPISMPSLLVPRRTRHGYTSTHTKSLVLKMGRRIDGK